MSFLSSDHILRLKSAGGATAARFKRNHGALGTIHPTKAVQSDTSIRRAADRPDDATPDYTGWR